ncbi:MAG: hypothetical protein WD226_08250 [Planctomycetota bacterium]
MRELNFGNPGPVYIDGELGLVYKKPHYHEDISTPLDSWVDVFPMDDVNDGKDASVPMVYGPGERPIPVFVEFYAFSPDPLEVYHVLVRDLQLNNTFEGVLAPGPCAGLVGIPAVCYRGTLTECEYVQNFPEGIKFYPNYEFVIEVHTGDLQQDPSPCPVYDTPVANTGMSTNKVYVLRTGTTAEQQVPWESVCELSCIAADDDNKRDEILFSLKEYFETAQINRKSRDGRWKPDGLRLGYWTDGYESQWLARISDPSQDGLLQTDTGSGTCGAWAFLFFACARVQGLALEPIDFSAPSGNGDIFGGLLTYPYPVHGIPGTHPANRFFVENVVIGNTTPPGDPNQPHNPPWNLALYGGPGMPNPPGSNPNVGLTYDDGIAGQNTANPERQMFSNHCQVFFSARNAGAAKTLVLLDPSYQKSVVAQTPSYDHSTQLAILWQMHLSFQNAWIPALAWINTSGSSDASLAASRATLDPSHPLCYVGSTFPAANQ